MSFVQDVTGGKPDDTDSLAIEPNLTASIMRRSLRTIVGRAIDFDAKTVIGAVEVQNIRPDGMLAAEPETRQLSAPQVLPQQNLGQ